MPKPRPSRPPAPPPASPELVRFVRDNWDIIEWKEARDKEISAMITGPGPWHITSEFYARARQILIDRGWPPPPGTYD